MDVRSLQQFVHLADTLHFGRASEACHISPSALSRHIKHMEELLGVSLFARDNRSVALTAEGELFLGYARDSLAQWDVVQNQLMERSGELHGEISMYCSVTASYSFLFDILSAFREAHPRIEIKLHTGDPEHSINRVMAGHEDIAIGARPAVLPVGLSFKPIKSTPLVFIVSDKQSALLQLGKPRWGKVPMILSETGLGRRRVDDWFTAQGIQPNVYAQVAGNEAIVSMVSLGFGVGVVPKIVLDNSPLADKIRVIDVEPHLETYDVGLFALDKKLKSPLIRAFWSLIRGTASS